MTSNSHSGSPTAAPQPPELFEEKVLYAGWTKLTGIKVRLPDGRLMEREVEHHGNAVSVLPYDPVRRVALLVRQFRAPSFYIEGQDETLEALAGMLDEDDPKAGMRREAMEEAGLRLGDLVSIGRLWPSPGLSAERAELFFAEYGTADLGQGPVEEGITVIELPLSELAAMADSNTIDDMKTMLLVQTLRLRRPDLFR